MKKKNLLKCLALTSMLALSVGAVTSCGTQGEQGPKGETGATGAKGEQGEKGDKGDTYYPVVILESDGGTISTDKVDGKKGDTYKLTFTPETKGEIVTKLVINYKEVDLTDEILSGTYTGTFSESVVVSAEFGSVAGYGDKLLGEYYLSLFNNDHQLKNYPALSEKTDKDLEIVVGSYDTSDVSDKYEDELDEIADAVADAKKANKDVTASELVKVVKEAVEAGKKAIDTVYATVLKTAKEKAVETAEDMYNRTYESAFTKEDREKMLASAKADIEKATTVQGVVDVVDAKLNNGVALGSYNATENLRSAAFAKVAAAMNFGSDTNLFTKDSEADKLEELKDALKEYGISINQLPSEIKASYDKKISEATALEYYTEDAEDDSYSKGDPKLGVEGYKAISESYANVKSSLKDAILKQYKNEINDSSTLIGTESKNTLIGVVDGAIGEWLATDSLGKTRTLADYMSTSIDSGKTAEGSGLVGYIENKFTDVIEQNYKAFGAERLTNAKKAVYASWSAKVDEILKDSEYKAMTQQTAIKNTSGTVTGYYAKKYHIVRDSSKNITFMVENPFIDFSNGTVYKGSNGKDESEQIYKTKENTKFGYKPSNVTITDAEKDLITSGTDNNGGKKYTTNYDVKSLLNSLAPVDADGNADTETEGTLWKMKSVDAVKRAGENYAGAFKKVYEAARKVYKNAVIKVLDNTTNFANKTYGVMKDYESKGYIGLDEKQVNLTSETGLGLFEACLPLKTDENENVVVDDEKISLSSYESAAKKVKDAEEALKALDEKVETWTTGTRDDGILSGEKLDTTTEMWKNLLDLTNSESVVRKILSGVVAKSDISDATKDLDKIYESGVKSYADSAKKYIEQAYTALHNSLTDINVVKKLENAYENVLKTYGYDGTEAENKYMGRNAKAFDLKTYKSVENWYKVAMWYLQYTAEMAGVTRAYVGQDGNETEVTLLAALAENGVAIKDYCCSNDQGTEGYESEEEALEAIAEELKASE